MSKKWSRNQKLILFGIITALIGSIIKFEFTVVEIREEINELKLKYASIETLNAKYAKINELFSENATFEGLKTTCPDGLIHTTIVTSNGFQSVCK